MSGPFILMISPHIAICYQFLLRETFDTLDALEKNPSLVSFIPKNQTSIHQLVHLLDAHIPLIFKRLLLRLEQFLFLQREQSTFPKIPVLLEQQSYKLSCLLRANEKLTDPYIFIVKKIAVSLLHQASFFSDNETVLFFILRHTKTIDHHMGSRFTLGLLNTLHPEGLDCVVAFIHKRYHEKGYDHLHPLIEKHIKTLTDAF